MPHAAIYKITQSILEAGDVEAFDTSPLEMQNAETKRKARSTGATNRTTIPEGVSQRGPRKKEGPPGLHTVAARAATTATTALKKTVTSNNLQRGKQGPWFDVKPPFNHPWFNHFWGRCSTTHGWFKTTFGGDVQPPSG